VPDRPATITEGPVALVIGQRWSLAIVSALAKGPLRFSALRSTIPGLSANLLALRLETLATAGIVQPVVLPPPASVAAYALTAWGAELGPIITRLENWASGGNRPTPATPCYAATIGVPA
jgi:DNA-binding HxlR family transcriptional regulator